MKIWKWIVIIIVLAVVGLYLYGHDEGLSFVDSVGHGWNNFAGGTGLPPLPDYPPADDDADDDADDADDDSTPPATGSWHTQRFSGSGTVQASDALTASSPLYTIPPFNTGDSDVIITIYHVWTDPNGCSPCDPGVVWCVHDSRATQVYHAVEPSPKATTATITGYWDGTNPWSAFIGNNCLCDINYAYTITIQWYG